MLGAEGEFCRFEAATSCLLAVRFLPDNKLCPDRGVGGVILLKTASGGGRKLHRFSFSVAALVLALVLDLTPALALSTAVLDSRWERDRIRCDGSRSSCQFS